MPLKGMMCVSKEGREDGSMESLGGRRGRGRGGANECKEKLRERKKIMLWLRGGSETRWRESMVW